MTKKQLRTEEIKQAIIDSGGIIEHAAKKLGIGRWNLDRRIHRSKRLHECLEQQKAKHLDLAEGHLLKAVELGQAWAIKFYLSRIGKSRGYGHKMEIDANVNMSGSMRVYKFPDDGRGSYGDSSN